MTVKRIRVLVAGYWLLVASRYFSMRNISMISTSTQNRNSPSGLSD